MGSSGDSRIDLGKMDYGCKHYRRRCRIRAPCCNEIFHCRHCHNESTVHSNNRHELCRYDVKTVICLICDSEQLVAKVCSNCGVNMGEYFCKVCKFYDDETDKGQYHCDECGICRVGGRDNFFHCKKCGVCYSIALLDKHLCIENSMRHHCPICYEYLFDSLQETSVLNCGHTIHRECFQEMINHSQYTCPICSKSVCNMSSHWRKLDEEVYYIYIYTRILFLIEESYLTTERESRATDWRRDEPKQSGTSEQGSGAGKETERKEESAQRREGRIESIVLMSASFRRSQIEATVMPSDYRYKIWILCNDCNSTSEVFFHIIGHKCSSCQSYNTRTIAPPPAAAAPAPHQ